MRPNTPFPIRWGGFKAGLGHFGGALLVMTHPRSQVGGRVLGPIYHSHSQSAPATAWGEPTAKGPVGLRLLIPAGVHWSPFRFWVKKSMLILSVRDLCDLGAN